MAIPTNNKGYLQSAAYYADPNNVEIPDETHHEHVQGIHAWVLATLPGLIGAGTLDEELLDLQQAQGLLAIRQAILNSTAVNSNYFYAVDEYEDETGVSTVTGGTYEPATDSYRATADSTHSLLVQSGGDADTSTTFADSTGVHTVVANGNVAHSTDQFKFGTSSIEFDSSAWLTVADSDDWNVGTGLFTMEAWVYATSFDTTQNAIISQRNLSDSVPGFRLVVQNDGAVRALGSSNGTSNTLDRSTATGLVTLNNWHHVAWVKDASDVLRIYVDGVQADSTTYSSGFIDVAAALSIGSDRPATSTNDWVGYMEEVSFLKGVCRYPDGTTFTPPTEPYSTSPADMELDSITFTAGSAPTNAVLVTLVEPIDSITINTDFISYVSPTADFANKATATYEFAGVEPISGANIYVAEVDLSGLTSGTSLRYYHRTANGKDLRVHATYLYYGA